MLCLVKTRVSECCERPVYSGAILSGGLVCNGCHEPCKTKIRECWLDVWGTYFVEVKGPDSEDVTPSGAKKVVR